MRFANRILHQIAAHTLILDILLLLTDLVHPVLDLFHGNWQLVEYARLTNHSTCWHLLSQPPLGVQ